MQKIETLILSHLLYNEEFSRKVLPYLKSIYFEDSTEQLVFNETYDEYIKKNAEKGRDGTHRFKDEYAPKIR